MIEARRQPCFTPTTTEWLEDWEPALTTWVHILVWNCGSMAIKVGLQPILCRIFQRRSRMIASNAFERSTKAMYMSGCCSLHFVASCWAKYIHSIVQRPRRNPHWDSGKTRSTCWSRRVSMIFASTLPATERWSKPRHFPHHVRSPICLYSRIMSAFCHCCWRYLADQQSRIKLRNHLRKAEPPYLMTLAGLLSGPAVLLSLRLRMTFATSSQIDRSSRFGMIGRVDMSSRKPD